MEKFIPYEKLSKKKQRALCEAKRRGWNGLSPVTRKPKNPKAYDRQKVRKWSDGSTDAPFYFVGWFNFTNTLCWGKMKGYAPGNAGPTLFRKRGYKCIFLTLRHGVIPCENSTAVP